MAFARPASSTSRPRLRGLARVKRAWQAPQLIVLTRSEPEEALLGYCKGGTHSGPAGANCIAVGSCFTVSES